MERHSKRRIEPRTIRNRYNTEYGTAGEAAEAINLRERDNMVTAAGEPEHIICLPDGHRLILADNRNGKTNYLTYCDTRIYLYAQNDRNKTSVINREICRAKAPVTRAVANGDFVIVTTLSDTIYLHFYNGNYSSLDISKAIPEIAFSAGETRTIETQVKGFAFKGNYTHWQNPLIPEDIEQANSILLDAYKYLCNRASSSDAWVEPIVVRYAVRLWDDSLLFSSMPVIIGNGLQCSNELYAEVATSNNSFLNVMGSTFSIKCYGMAMSVIKGCGTEWEPLIKSIDIYYASAGELLTDSAPYYRCETTQTGGRRYFLRFSLAHEPISVAGENLANARQWKMAARITDIKALHNRQAKGLGITKIKDLTGGYLNESTYIVYNRGYFSAEIDRKEFIPSTKTSARIQVPSTLITNAGKAYWGGGNNCLVNRHSLISSASTAFTNDRGNAYIALDIPSKDGDRKIVALQYFTAGFTMLNPLIAFPFTTATKVEIKTLSAQKVHTFTCELQSDELGEYSYFIAPDLLPMEMELDPDYDFTLPEAQNTNERIHGTLRETRENNPFVTENVISLGDAAINAISFARKPVSSNIFGRYPMYVFTSDGIFAVSTDKGHALPRLIDHNTVNGQNCVASTPYGEMFVAENCLKLLNGSKCTILERGIDCSEILWCFPFDELWTRNSNNGINVFNHEGRHYSRSIMANTFSGGIVCNTENCLLNIEKESQGISKIHYLSHPFEISGHITGLKWNIFGQNVDIKASLYGETGLSCHGETIKRTHLTGTASVPVFLPLKTRKYRSARIEITGAVPSGTSIRETELTVKP